VSERRVNLLLWTLAGICTAGAVLSFAFAVLVPLESATGDTTVPATRPASQQLALRGMPALAEYEPIFSAVLRQPTTDAPPPSEPAVTVDVAPAAAADRPALTLVGTIGQSLAMLRNERGEIEVKGVGDVAGGAKVVSIRTSRVEMQHNGRSIVLEKPKEPTPGS
jgi:hypothetical protein